MEILWETSWKADTGKTEKAMETHEMGVVETSKQTRWKFDEPFEERSNRQSGDELGACPHSQCMWVYYHVTGCSVHTCVADFPL
jgi:hypothetical protein